MGRAVERNADGPRNADEGKASPPTHSQMRPHVVRACGIDFEQAVGEGGVEHVEIDGVRIPLATKAMLIRMKDTERPSDAADAEYLKLRLDEE